MLFDAILQTFRRDEHFFSNKEEQRLKIRVFKYAKSNQLKLKQNRKNWFGFGNTEQIECVIFKNHTIWI